MACSITCAQESCNTARVRWAEGGKVTMVAVTRKKPLFEDEDKLTM